MAAIIDNLDPSERSALNRAKANAASRAAVPTATVVTQSAKLTEPDSTGAVTDTAPRNTAPVVTPTPTPTPTTTTKLSTNQRIANTIADYAAANPPGPHQHYGATLDANGVPRLYWDTGWSANGPVGGTSSTPVTGGGAGGGTGSTSTSTGSTTSTTTDNTALITATKQEGVRTALQDLTAQLSGVGLKGLVDVIDAAIKNNQTAAQIADTVRASAEYQARFPGMKALAAKGQAINEATYIQNEQGYTQTLHAYGLDTATYGSTSALGEYIANQVSPSEFNARVDAAANRVEKNPDVLASLQNFYGVDKATAIGYILDPKKGMDLINKQVRASEIGAAASAASYKFNLNVTQAESLVPQIGTEDLASLKKEFGTAGLEATTQSRLAQIEGGAYDANQEIQSAVVGNAQAQLESQRRAQRESQLRFGGSGSSVTRQSTVGAI